MSQELAGKVAIVTGAASGIGRATAELFVAEGARVVIADINDGAGEATARELGDAAFYHRADVGVAEDIDALVAAAVDRFGGLHVMFNNAGVSCKPSVNFLDDELPDFARVMQVNVLGVIWGTQRAARHMARNGGGSIINNASIAGLIPGLAMLAYRTSKVAAIHASKSMAIDLAQYGIRVNCLAPGHIPTDLNAFAPPGATVQQAERIQVAMKPVWDANKPLKRQGVPHDVAQAALFLAGDRAAQITGTVLAVDGGISAGDPVNHFKELMDARASAMADGE
ncbi:SDR family NAD(P)-dependent oxidoreductase [Novosphingobium sp. 9U]|uniref:SDR family NAD(P)-dependent oxidoreductase n=1 Tax=Novosphingobium sp. 9U TaxID=2653158 RepID=UPI0012F132C1|nr:SDR family oxidoreductase [Novosphingobium sp. 9U]VWX54210.1 SDR family oxidoreductase [Novosphingobium sp. 9U]